MKPVKWDNIEPKFQEQLLWLERTRMLEKRERIIKTFGLEKADDVWYTKLDYIANWKYPDGYSFDICEDCGRPRELMVCVSDKPGSYQSRDVVYQCPCGKKHEINC